VLHSELCERLQIEGPLIQAAIAPATAPELAAAVSNAGGLGSLGAIFLSAEALSKQLERPRELTSRPFAVNHVVPLLSEEAFALTWQAKPALVSFALGDASALVKQAHEAGILVMHQVHTLGQARQAAQWGVDVMIAQGSEAGGMTGTVAALALIPQVVEAVNPMPVVAAGGIADGRAMAAALVLGAQGVNLGTRFLASREAAAPQACKQMVLASESEQAVKVAFWPDVFPPSGPGPYEVWPRALRTPFIDGWQGRHQGGHQEAEQLRAESMTALHQRRQHEWVPFSGQSAGLIHEILPAGEIVRRILSQAEEALAQATRHLKEKPRSTRWDTHG
jgi:nitronate monooxygenase/enoyl-[acyl-carrier protein] reductase II